MTPEFKKVVKFSPHALNRARQRKLWKYVNKEYVYYADCKYGKGEFLPVLSSKPREFLQIKDCVYVLENHPDKTIVVTMYQL